jgi:hypothetical protein
VILCVAFPNLLLRRLGFRDLGSGGGIFGDFGHFWGFRGKDDKVDSKFF